jgi:hypothetical protein
MSTYVSNVDKFKVMTINEFPNGKRTKIQRFNPISDEFLKENAATYHA